MLKSGINNCTNAEYHGDSEFISSSGLKQLLEDSEKFYKERVLGQREQQAEQTHFTEGSLLHSLILEPHRVAEEYAFYEGLRKQGSDYEQFLAANPGKAVISKPQRIRSENYLKAYRDLPVAPKLIAGCLYEHTICQQLGLVPIKVRCDAINIDKGYIVDVKTSGFDIDIDNWKLTIKKWSYQLSAALYLRVAEQFYGKPFEFYFLIVDKKNAVCEVYKLSKATREEGEFMVNKALALYKRCKETGNWTNKPAPAIIEMSTEYEILEC